MYILTMLVSIIYVYIHMHVQTPLLNSENMKFTSLSFSADGTGVEWSGLSALNCI